MKISRDLKRAYKMYQFFEANRNEKAYQPPKIVKFFQVYQMVRTR